MSINVNLLLRSALGLCKCFGLSVGIDCKLRTHTIQNPEWHVFFTMERCGKVKPLMRKILCETRVKLNIAFLVCVVGIDFGSEIFIQNTIYKLLYCMPACTM